MTKDGTVRGAKSEESASLWKQAIADADTLITEQTEAIKKARRRILRLRGAKKIFEENLAKGELWPAPQREPKSTDKEGRNGQQI